MAGTNSDEVQQQSTTTEAITPSFQKFEVTTSGAGNLVLTPNGEESPAFYLKNSTFSFHKLTPSLTLHSGSATGPVLAVLKLGKIKPHTVGIGDPNSGEDEKVVWESLKKGGSWRSPSWDFDFGNGGVEGGRKKYRWESDGKLGFTKGKPGLILREIGKEEVLARYEWMKGGKVSPWGVFELRKGKEERVAGEELSGLEKMALITALCVVVSKGSGI